MNEFNKGRLAVQLMRRLMSDYPDEFVVSAMRYLDTADESDAHRFLATMLLRQPATFDQIADPALRSKPQAARLLKRFLTVDPSFDVRFARCLPDRTGANHLTAFDSVRSERALDVLDETSRGRRLLPILGHLPNSSNSRLSSRAVLFIGRRVMSPAWVEKQLQQLADPRARANAVEGIWGLNSQAAKELLAWCTEDGCNRVVGNALIGLSIAGEPGVPEEINRLSLHAEDPFRSTAAWAMGKLGDAAFLDALEKLARDASASVRSTALRAMVGIRQVVAEAEAAKPVEIPLETTPEAMEEPAQVIETEPVNPIIEVRLDGHYFANTRDNMNKRG